MEDIFGSVRRSLAFRSPDGGGGDGGTAVGTLADKINTCIRRSRVFSKLSPSSVPPSKDDTPPIRWRKGELIGCGAFGRVYMGMNLDSGELLAVKEVSIAANSATKEKAQAHVKELEEEVKLLKTLSHCNIVRYLGTVRGDETLNILLEFVSGGSISALLGKFGPFPEAVIKMYTMQLLLGLEYLHKNGIMHRDIKGANILVDNKGRIKLADFGASKQVVELATVSGAKSMKGTPYWMAPEVILQTGHSFSADIWSVGCTVIEMATGKPPWSQQYQEVAALFYIGTTKSHPPIPEHLSDKAKDFLLKCLQKEPELRPSSRELRQHPFVTGESVQSSPLSCTSFMEKSKTVSLSCGINQENYHGKMDICNLGSLSCSTANFDKYMWEANRSEDHMRMVDDGEDIGEEGDTLGWTPDRMNKSFNPMCEPSDNWTCKDEKSPRLVEGRVNMVNDHLVDRPACGSGASGKGYKECHEASLSEDDDELTESKIKGFLDEKALELKKLQTPLYEEFYNSLIASPAGHVDTVSDENSPNYLKLPPKSRSPNRILGVSPSAAVDGMSISSPGSSNRRISNISSASNQNLPGNLSPQLHDCRGPSIDADQEPSGPIFSEITKKWKEELDQELERKREIMRQAGVGGKTSSPNDRALNRPRERSRFSSPGK